jgi:hypothetical protein
MAGGQRSSPENPVLAIQSKENHRTGANRKVKPRASHLERNRRRERTADGGQLDRADDLSCKQIGEPVRSKPTENDEEKGSPDFANAIRSVSQSLRG